MNTLNLDDTLAGLTIDELRGMVVALTETRLSLESALDEERNHSARLAVQLREQHDATCRVVGQLQGDRDFEAAAREREQKRAEKAEAEMLVLQHALRLARLVVAQGGK